MFFRGFTDMRRLLTAAAFIVIISGIAFASFPTTDIINELIKAEKLNDLIGDQYWLMSGSFGSPQRYKTDHVKDPDGKSMKGELVPAGSSVDRAWTIETGDPEVVIAIIDTGAQWDKPGLINKYHLNKGELNNGETKGKTQVLFAPDYRKDDNGNYMLDQYGKAIPIWDRFKDNDNLNTFNVRDYEPDGKSIACSSYDKKEKECKEFKVTYSYIPGGYNGHPAFFKVNNGKIEFFNDTNDNGFLDPQDLIRTFADGKDTDGNGFIDDICGWDFFENDNDADDVSSYTSTALYHGTGQFFSAGGELLDNSELIDELGICPNCMMMPIRTWDSFVQDTNYFGLGVIYAAINGASIIEGALGGLYNSGICKDAVEFAYKRGLPIFMGSSDINSANHNWPTYLNEPMYCSGMVPDTYLQGLMPRGVSTWFRNSGLAQFGSKSQICFEVGSASHSTALSSGSAGLLVSLAKHKIEKGEIGRYYQDNGQNMPLHPDQLKQLLTLSAEDVVPEDTVGTGDPDPSQVGWDQHFGYGRVNLYWAVKMLNDGKIPAVALITAPQWSHYLDPVKDSLELRGDVLYAGTDAKSWVIEAGYGIEPSESELKGNVIRKGSEQGRNIDFGGPVSLSEIRKVMPFGLDMGFYSKEPDMAYRGDKNIQANRHMFTIRLRVLDGDGKRIAEDRRTFFMCEDKNLHIGWPKFIGVGGEASPRFEDLDGDNNKEVIVATSDGRILIYTHNGEPFKYKGETVEFSADEVDSKTTSQAYLEIAREEIFKTLNRRIKLRPSFVTPAVADIDNDGVKEIVGVAGETAYCFYLDRTRDALRMDFSENFIRDVKEGKIHNADHDLNNPANKNSIENPLSPGAMAPPVLFDINNDGYKEIIVAAHDQRIYAWDKNGRQCQGWPVYSRKYEKVGQKIFYSPCIADLDGDGRPELVVSTNEVVSADGKTPVEQKEQEKTLKNKLSNMVLASGVSNGSKTKIPGELVTSVLDTITGLAGKECMIYAIKGEGNGDFSDGGRDYKFSSRSFVKGWPVSLKALLPDILPQLGPSTKPAAFDYDNDGADEIVASATSAQTAIIDGDGRIINQMKRSPMGSRAKSYLSDPSLCLSLFNSCAIGNLDNDENIEIAQSGITLFGALNLFISGQNFPYNHVLQVWDSKSGGFEDAFPRPVDDFILYSEPAIADADGDGVNEVITGSGLGLVHAIGTDGLDRGIFPKQSAGWIMATPAVSDIDGDGKNEVAVVTREGGIFIWDTEGGYTSDSRGKPLTWPTYGHDNCNTSNLGYDATAPAAVTSYKFEEGEFTFKCPGGDGFNGRAKAVSIYGYSEPINVGNFAYATLVTHIKPVENGKDVYLKMPDDHKCYAIVAVDEAGNRSQLPLTGGIPESGQPVLSENAPDDGGGGSSGGLCFLTTAIHI